LGANEVKEEPSELLMKKVMSTEASVLTVNPITLLRN